MIRWIVIVAALLGFLSVLVGAFGAHGMESQLEGQGFSAEDIAKKIDQCEVAVRYQMFHVLAILALGLMGQDACPKKRVVATVFFLLGITAFSGGLYSMVFLDLMGHWSIVPLGGLCFMVGWICLILVGLDKSMLETQGSGEVAG
ncbi:MAG: DUF423 domain-containing protein [Planctomycetota bacterium]